MKDEELAVVLRCRDLLTGELKKAGVSADEFSARIERGAERSSRAWGGFGINLRMLVTGGVIGLAFRTLIHSSEELTAKWNAWKKAVMDAGPRDALAAVGQSADSIARSIMGVEDSAGSLGKAFGFMIKGASNYFDLWAITVAGIRGDLDELQRIIDRIRGIEPLIKSIDQVKKFIESGKEFGTRELKWIADILASRAEGMEMTKREAELMAQYEESLKRSAHAAALLAEHKKRILEVSLQPMDDRARIDALVTETVELAKYLELQKGITEERDRQKEREEDLHEMRKLQAEEIREWVETDRDRERKMEAARAVALALRKSQENQYWDEMAAKGVWACDQIYVATQRLQEVVYGVVQIFGTQLFAYMDDLVEGTVKPLRDYLKDILKDLIRMTGQMALNIAAQAISAAAGGGAYRAFAAKGGVFPESRARIPIRAYQAGGITKGPELAVYGEGSRREAVVPLPDNRSIPVKILGGQGGGLTVNIAGPADGEAVRRMLYKEFPFIVSLLRRAASENSRIAEG